MTESAPHATDDILFGLDAERLHAVRESRLAATLDRIFSSHAHYRARFAELGIRRADIRTLEDLRKLPITSKADYMAAPDSFVLVAGPQADDEERAQWDTMYTTGSTAAPTPFVSTSYDFLNILAANVNMMRLRGVTALDSVLNLFPLTLYPHGAFARALHAPAAFGIPVTAALPGKASARRPEVGRRLDEIVALAARVQPSILWGVPSYIRTLLGRAEEQGVRLPSVRLVFVTGEGFGEAARAAMLDALRRLGAAEPRISISYGATEMQGGMVECTAGSGYHNPAPDQFLIEAVDPQTHLPVADGAPGLLLLTHLDRRGTVMLRYSMGDVAELTRSPCPHCGALTERLTSIPFRVDGLVKIKGMLVNPLVLVDSVNALAGIADFQALVRKQTPSDPLSPDQLIIRLAMSNTATEGLVQRVIEAVRSAIRVTPEVELVDAVEISAGRGWKAKPLIDERATPA